MVHVPDSSRPTHWLVSLVVWDRDYPLAVLCQFSVNLMCDRNLKEEIRMVDHKLLLERCAVKAPLIAEIEERIGWARFWDATLNLGVQHTRGLQMLSRVMSHHGRGNRPCPLCDTAPLESSVMEHLLGAHCVTV